jgi:hypothetical protein
MKSRSFDNLNCRTRCGWKPCARKMRCTQLTLLPAASANGNAGACESRWMRPPQHLPAE